MNTKSQSRKRSHAESVSMSPTSYHHQNATISSDYIDYDNSSPKSGKWTPEEEQFANKLIQDFELGLLLDCENGCTLRSYLARKLNCAPMRISKKFAGQCIGKHVFTRRPENDRMIVRDDFNHPPAKFLKLTMQEMPGGMMHFNTNYDITRDASFFRRDSNTSDITADSTDSISCTTNEFEEISDNSEAAEWRDVLSFFCGEFNLDNEDTAIYRSNNNNNPSSHSNNHQNNNNNNDLLLFNFQEDWNA